MWEDYVFCLHHGEFHTVENPALHEFSKLEQIKLSAPHIYAYKMEKMVLMLNKDWNLQIHIHKNAQKEELAKLIEFLNSLEPYFVSHFFAKGWTLREKENECPAETKKIIIEAIHPWVQSKAGLTVSN